MTATTSQARSSLDTSYLPAGQRLVITMDGPSASGKGTVSYLIARKYGLVNIDSGACYRAIAWLALEHKLDLDEQSVPKIVDLLDTYPLVFTPNPQDLGPKSFIKVGSQDITEHIRTSEVAEAASRAGTLQPLRQLMKKYQRQLIKQADYRAVLEGRDVGSVVYPEADLKFFLTSSIEVRAQRRHTDYVDAGLDISFEEVYAEIAERDRRDTERAYSALRIAEGAIVIDSTPNTIDMTIEQISQHIDNYLRTKRRSNSH